LSDDESAVAWLGCRIAVVRSPAELPSEPLVDEGESLRKTH
jgi:hypothetical protein